MPAQYGEEQHLIDAFGDRADGVVVDVGAADGVTHSNSLMLIDRGWRAILIEPLPEHLWVLERVHRSNDRVKIVRRAIATFSGHVSLWRCGQASTTVPAWRDSMIEHRGCRYGQPIQVDAAPLSEVLDAAACPTRIELLSVDCEGADADVLESMDWQTYSVGLVCHEGREPGGRLQHLLERSGFEHWRSTRGNALWRNRAWQWPS